MKNKSHLVLILLLSACTFSSFAQMDDEPFIGSSRKQKNTDITVNTIKGFDKSKIRFSPGPGVGFDGRYLVLQFTNRLGYRIIKYIEPGLGLSYQFQNLRADKSYNGYQGHTLGGSIYLRFYPYKELFLHVEGTMKKFWYRDKPLAGPKPAFNTASYGNVLVGLGYNVAIGNKSWFTPMILINLIPNLPYNNTRQVIPETNITIGF